MFTLNFTWKDVTAALLIVGLIGGAIGLVEGIVEVKKESKQEEGS